MYVAVYRGEKYQVLLRFCGVLIYARHSCGSVRAVAVAGRGAVRMPAGGGFLINARYAGEVLILRNLYDIS